MKKYTYYSRIRKRRILFKRLRFAGILLCAALLVFGGVKLFQRRSKPGLFRTAGGYGGTVT